MSVSTAGLPTCNPIQYLVLESLKGPTDVPMLQIRHWIEQKGGDLSPSSVSQIVGRMVVNGFVKKKGRGKYALTIEGAKEIDRIHRFYKR